MLKVNTFFSSHSIVDFEQVNVSWDFKSFIGHLFKN